MFKQVSAEEAQSIISEKNCVIMDVRDRESFEESHMPSATHFTVSDLTAFCDKANVELPVLVYCYKGISSQSVARHLVEAGFKRVYSLIGGFEAWKAFLNEKSL